MGLANTLIQFYLVNIKKAKNTRVCCVRYGKQTVRVSKTVKSY